MLGKSLPHIFLIKLNTFLRDDTGSHFFAEELARNTYDLYTVDCFETADRILDFAGHDIFTAPYNEFLDTSRKVQIAVLIKESDISCMKPSFLIYRLVFKRYFIISYHQIESLHEYLTAYTRLALFFRCPVDDLYIYVVYGLTDRCCYMLMRITIRSYAYRSHFGQAVGCEKVIVRKRFLEHLYLRFRCGCPRYDRAAQCPKIQRIKILVLHKCDQHGRNRMEKRTSVFGYHR